MIIVSISNDPKLPSLDREIVIHAINIDFVAECIYTTISVRYKSRGDVVSLSANKPELGLLVTDNMRIVDPVTLQLQMITDPDTGEIRFKTIEDDPDGLTEWAFWFNSPAGQGIIGAITQSILSLTPQGRFDI